MTASVTVSNFNIDKKQLLSNYRRTCRWMPVKHYQKVHDFILHELTFKNEVSLCSLLDEAARTLANDLPPNYTWILLQVKNDMEAREIIETYAGEKGARMIRRC